MYDRGDKIIHLLPSRALRRGWQTSFSRLLDYTEKAPPAMRTRSRMNESRPSPPPPPELEILRQRCHVANPLTKSVSRPKVHPDRDTREERVTDVDTEKMARKQRQRRLQKLCRLDVNPVQPLCGVALQCRRIQANLPQSAVARMTGSSEAFIDAVEIGIQTPSHELWQRLVTSMASS